MNEFICFLALIGAAALIYFFFYSIFIYVSYITEKKLNKNEKKIELIEKKIEELEKKYASSTNWV